MSRTAMVFSMPWWHLRYGFPRAMNEDLDNWVFHIVFHHFICGGIWVLFKSF
jgi:hypothetical protein